MPPALQTTALLLLRGALFHKLGVQFAKSVVSGKSSPDGTETVTVKLAQAPSEQQVASAFKEVNVYCEDGAAVQVVDVALSSLSAEAPWYDHEQFGCEFAKYKPKEVDAVLRVAYLPGFSFSLLAHPIEAGPEYLANVNQISRVDLVKHSFNDKKQELTLEYRLVSSGNLELAQLRVEPSLPDLALKQCLDSGAEEEDFVEPSSASGQVVTPWSVEGKDGGGIQYSKLIVEFGVHEIDPPLLDFFREVTGREPHAWLRRGIFFSHRDLKEALVAKQQGKPFYLYTGRGPSSESLHFGHLIPFMFTKWLQDVFDCPLVIQLTDDEKYLFQKLDKPLDEFQRLGYENARDIMAVGFNPQKTFIFLNTEYMGHFYPLVCEIQKHVTYNQTRGIFGFTGSTSIGQIAFPAIQAAPSFSEAFPVVLGGSRRMTCLIPCAIDQDPYFRMTRDVAKKLGLKKPALVHAKFFPALQGINAKMSGSIATSAVMVSDSEQDIRKKIASAFSGGRSGDGQQELLGANLDEDVAFQWLRFFEMDDAELARIERLYGPGQLEAGEARMMTKEVKTLLADKIVGMAATHQASKLALTQDTMNEVFRVRCIL